MGRLKPLVYNTLALIVLNLLVSLWPKMGWGDGGWGVEDGDTGWGCLSPQGPLQSVSSGPQEMPPESHLHSLYIHSVFPLLITSPQRRYWCFHDCWHTRWWATSGHSTGQHQEQIQIESGSREELVLSRQTKPSALPCWAHNTPGLINPHAPSELVTQKKWNSKFCQ